MLDRSSLKRIWCINIFAVSTEDSTFNLEEIQPKRAQTIVNNNKKKNQQQHQQQATQLPETLFQTHKKG